MRCNHVSMTIAIHAVLLGFSSLAWGQAPPPPTAPPPINAQYKPGYAPQGEETYSDGPPGGAKVLVYISVFNDATRGFGGRVESRVYRHPDDTYTFAYVIDRENETSGHHLIRASFEDEDNSWQNVAIEFYGADGSGHSSGEDHEPEWTDGDPYYIAIDRDYKYPTFRWRESNDGTAIGPGDKSSVIWLKTKCKCSKVGSMQLGNASEGAVKADVLVPNWDATGIGCRSFCSSIMEWWRHIAVAAMDCYFSLGGSCRQGQA